MKKIILIFSTILMQSCNSLSKTADISTINKESILIKTLKSQDFDNNDFLKKNILPLDNFLLTKEKKIYKGVFEKLEFENSIYYSFYISSKNRDATEEKIILKFINKRVERYLLRYSRTNSFEVDQSTFEIDLLELKSNNQFNILPFKKECLRSKIIADNKTDPNLLDQYNVYLFSIKEKCDIGSNKKIIHFPILSPIETIPLYLVY